MTQPPPPLIVANWKMCGLGPEVGEARRLAEALQAAPSRARVAICPPATLLERIGRALTGSPVRVGAQDVHAEPCGAHTGDVSVDMLVDAGASFVIVGHSERRTAYGETDAQVAAKARAALAGGLEAIVCVGETAEEHAAGLTAEVVRRQARDSLPPEAAARPFALAYEPRWAIGAGRTPGPEEIMRAHAALREVLRSVGGAAATAPILYGGSVKPENAAAILALDEVGGALVGGASLPVDTFLRIVRAGG